MELSKKDKKWQTFNKRLQKQMKENDFWGLGTTYYEMASFLEAEGKEAEHLRQKGYEMKLEAEKEILKQYSTNPYLTKLEIYANCSDSCEECKRLSGTIVLLKEAIASPPIPVKNCSFPYGCRCTFLPIVD